jgi:exodeoxyribonuclease VII small subunit
MSKTKEAKPGFEESLSDLEKIVKQLESGELPLERALKLFEEGVVLARQCQSQLEEAERKVELLLRERGEIKTIPFESVNLEQSDENSSAQVSSSRPGKTGDAGAASRTEGQEEKLNDAIPF